MSGLASLEKSTNINVGLNNSTLGGKKKMYRKSKKTYTSKKGGNPPHLHSCYQYKSVGGKSKYMKNTTSKVRKSKKTNKRKTSKKSFFTRLFKL
jgi:hypothetical protein